MRWGAVLYRDSPPATSTSPLSGAAQPQFYSFMFTISLLPLIIFLRAVWSLVSKLQWMLNNKPLLHSQFYIFVLTLLVYLLSYHCTQSTEQFALNSHFHFLCFYSPLSRLSVVLSGEGDQSRPEQVQAIMRRRSVMDPSPHQLTTNDFIWRPHESAFLPFSLFRPERTNMW